MRRVIIESIGETDILLKDVDISEPIFAKRDGKLIGMLVKERDSWILRVGGSFGAYECLGDLRNCISYGIERFNYEFFVEDR